MNTMYDDCDEITDSLVSELEGSCDSYRIEQEIAERNQMICSIEDITGPSKRTKKLFEEVDALEILLKNSVEHFYEGSVDKNLS
jgi:hypothetical protein